jgi:hypothetical protein
MKYYIYNADIGTFEIRKVDHFRYQLFINEEMLGEYESAELAAEDIATFNTDYVEWDNLEHELEDVPATLSQWTVIKGDTPPK